MMTWNYTNIRSSGVSSVQREASQLLGRPWTRMCPTIGVIENTFADKTNDSTVRRHLHNSLPWQLA